MGRCHVTESTTNPTVAPTATSLHWLNTVTKETFYSVGTDSVSDWVSVATGAVVTDHAGLTNIGTNTHADIDNHIADTNNPHSVNATQVGLGNVDNTSDLDKPISTATQTAIDAINQDTNLSRIDSGALVASDIVLTRDDATTVNVDVSSIVNDIASNNTQGNTNTAAIAVNATATGTNLATNNTQDTNIAQNVTDIAQNASNLTSHINDVDPHPQYLTQPEGDARYAQILPNQLLRFPEPTPTISGASFTPVINAAGTAYEFFRDFFDFERRTDPLIHQLITGANDGFFEYLTLSTDLPVAGDYELELSYRWSMNAAGSNFLAHIRDGNGDFIYPYHLEPADSAGTGEIVPTSTGGTANTGTDQVAAFHRKQVFTLPAGPQTFILEYRGQLANLEPTIYDAYMSIKRVRVG